MRKPKTKKLHQNDSRLKNEIGERDWRTTDCPSKWNRLYFHSTVLRELLCEILGYIRHIQIHDYISDYFGIEVVLDCMFEVHPTDAWSRKHTGGRFPKIPTWKSQLLTFSRRPVELVVAGAGPHPLKTDKLLVRQSWAESITCRFQEVWVWHPPEWGGQWVTSGGFPREICEFWH